MSRATVEEVIQQEEALVRVYHAELAILQQQQQQQQHHNHSSEDDRGDEDSEEDNDNDNDTESSSAATSETETMAAQGTALLTSIVEKESTILQSLTQSIQGFVFSSVEQQGHNNKDATEITATATQQHYVLQGHFVANPQVTACIHMTILPMDMASSPTSWHNNDTNPPPRKRQKATLVHGGKVIQLECQLSSKTNVDLSHIQNGSDRRYPVTNKDPDDGNNNNNNNNNDSERTKNTTPTSTKINSLPDWIRRVSSYLEFETRRDACLRQWETIHGCQWSKQKQDASQVRIVVPQQSRIPRFVWEWSWEEERDLVRLEVPNNNNKHNGKKRASNDFSNPKGFQDLLSCAGSCEKALELILETLV